MMRILKTILKRILATLESLDSSGLYLLEHDLAVRRELLELKLARCVTCVMSDETGSQSVEIADSQATQKKFPYYRRNRLKKS